MSRVRKSRLSREIQAECKKCTQSEEAKSIDQC